MKRPLSSGIPLAIALIAILSPRSGFSQVTSPLFEQGPGGTLIISPTRVDPRVPIPLPPSSPSAAPRPGVKLPPAHPLTTLDGSRLPGHLDPVPPALKVKTTYELPPGPWGKLDYYVTILRVPRSFEPFLEFPPDQTIWHFPETDIGQVEQLLKGVGFPARVGDRAWQKALRAQPKANGEGIYLLPEPDLVRALSPEGREKLADILRRSQENLYYREPTIVEFGDPVSWFKDSGLSDETVQLIADLCYRSGRHYVFSDLSLVSSTLNTLQERRTFLRALTRTRTLVLRLKVGQSENNQDLAAYWAAGHKNKAILPILESVSENPDVEYLDVAHLLPPTPRKLLYTFPDLEEAINGLSADCHWTAYNFTRSRPTPLSFNDNVLVEAFYESYEALDPAEPLRFGDVITFVDRSRNASKHMAVYIAGDIVFTKNGMGNTSPWILMRYADMLAGYHHLFPRCETGVFRLR